MAAPTDDRQISLDEVKAAAAARDLAGLVERLTRERSWSSLAMLFTFVCEPAGVAQVSLLELHGAVKMLDEVLQAFPPQRRARSPLHEELRNARLMAAEALIRRITRPGLGELERSSLRVAAGLLFDAGEFKRAASLYEELGDDSRAGDAFGAMGDLDKMEVALARDEARHRSRTSAVEAMHEFAELLGAGERVAAIAAAGNIPEGIAEAATAHELARRLETKLCRGTAVTLRAADGRTIRLAAVPAVLGRDLGAEVPVRDPGASRRHAAIVLRAGELALEDVGSRGGVRLGGASLAAPLPLRGGGEFALGADCRIEYRTADTTRVILTGLSGLDRQLRAVVGHGALPLGDVLPEAAGLSVAFDTGVARLTRAPGVSVRVDAKYISGGCDLLHGDVIDVRAGAGAALRLEVV
ncbi:MAG TPA: FHA domain-containing protein [Polyangia bacterium]|nr:FHA domain-containing protein [Polyangia bacterium]